MNERFAELLEDNVKRFDAIIKSLPDNALLPIATAEELKARLEEALNKGDIYGANRIFWMDQLTTFEAWKLMFLWRMSEQSQTVLLLREKNQIVSCASVCRSAFELAINALITSAKLSSVLNQIDESRVKNTLSISNTFPTDVELAIFGTRIAERVGINIPTQISILTHLKKLNKNPLGSKIEKSYELLCDITHPNWLGNRPFYRRGSKGTIVSVSATYDSEWKQEVQSTIESTLSWTIHAASNVADQSNRAIVHARSAFKEEI